MTQPPDIALPEELIPADGRFGAGPSKVRAGPLQEVTARSLYVGTSHRREPVRTVVHAIRAGLRELYALPDGFEVVLGVGGTTAFWEIAAFSLIETRSCHAVFGEFSAKFARVAEAAPFLESPRLVEADPGSFPTMTAAADVDAYALTQCETSTGVAMPVARPTGDGLVLVDATSAAGAMAADPVDFDAYYFSPQKAFGSEGGLWVALLSPAADRALLWAECY